MSFDGGCCRDTVAKSKGTIFNEFLDIRSTVDPFIRYLDLIYILNLLDLEISLHLNIRTINILTILNRNPMTNQDKTMEIFHPLTLPCKNLGAGHHFFTMIFLINKTPNLIVVISIFL